MHNTILSLLGLVMLGLATTACGGAEPEAEATWETNTAAPEDDDAASADAEPTTGGDDGAAP